MPNPQQKEKSEKLAFGSVLQFHGILLTFPVGDDDEFEGVVFAAAIVIAENIEFFEFRRVVPKFKGDVFLDVSDCRLR